LLSYLLTPLVSPGLQIWTLFNTNAVPVNLLFYLFTWFHGVGSTAATDSDAGNFFQNQKKILFRMWQPQVCEALMMWNSITPNRAVNTTALKYLAV